jgi:arginine transport system permease protein
MIETILTYFPTMLSGLVVTLELMICALIFGLLLALLFTMISATNRFYLKAPIDAFIFFIRGTPLLVQIFIIYYGSGEMDWLRETFLWDILKKPFGCATIALGLNTAAYTTALFLGAIRAVPQGEIEACKVLGLTHRQMLQRVILPRALRIALPAYSNEVIMILKSTSLASTITLLDLMGVTRHLVSLTYEVLPFFLVAGILYLIINGLIIAVFKYLESNSRCA